MSRYSAWLLRLFWLVPLSFYWFTAARGTGWIDAPMIAYHVSRLATGTWVNRHSLFYYLGRAWSLLVPVGDLHYSLNLFCGLCGAVTVHLVFLCGWRLTRNVSAALIGALALMLSHSLWWHSTMLEVYTLNTALMSLMLYLVIRYDETGRLPYLYSAVCCLGLGMSNHVLMALFGAAFAALFLMRTQRSVLWRPRVLLTILFFFVAGFQIYLLEVVRDYSELLAETPSPTLEQRLDALHELADRATGAHFRENMFPDEMSTARRWKWRLNYLFTWFMNYPSIAFLLGGIGLVAARRLERFRLSLTFFGVALLVQAIWSSNYMIWDMYAFGLPVWVLFSVLVVLGADRLMQAGILWRRALIAALPTLLIPLVLYGQIAVWAQRPGFWKEYFAMYAIVENLWDPARYFADPNKRRAEGADVVLEQMLAAIPEGAHLYDDDCKGHFPLELYYGGVLGRRTDIDYHALFGPTFDDEQALLRARQMKGLLEAGERVFLSSLHWPERPVMEALYGLIEDERGLPRSDVKSMTLEELEQSFPEYRLRRIHLGGRDDRYIFELLPGG